MRFLITAGPTREYLDSVRYLSNGSSGKMGYACAKAARDRGHQVTLLSGPVELEKPAGVKAMDVISAEEMHRAAMREFSRCDAVIMTAAVCDYRPAVRSRCKISKQKGNLHIHLIPPPDILAELGRRKKRQILIGFAVQDRSARKNAERKLRSKNLDAIVLNSPAAIGADRSEIEILQSGKRWEPLGTIPKRSLAKRLIRLAEQLSASRK